MYYRNWQAVSGPTVPQGDFIGNAIKMATEATGGWQKAQQDNAAGFMAQEAAKYQDPAELQKALASGAITQGIDSRYITPALMKQMDERVAAGREQQHKATALDTEKARLGYYQSDLEFRKEQERLKNKGVLDQEIANKFSYGLQQAIDSGDPEKIKQFTSDPAYQAWAPLQGTAALKAVKAAEAEVHTPLVNNMLNAYASLNPVEKDAAFKAALTTSFADQPGVREKLLAGAKAQGVKTGDVEYEANIAKMNGILQEGATIAPANTTTATATATGFPLKGSDWAAANGLTRKESGGRPDADNGLGYVGLLQFGKARLTDGKNAGVVPKDMTPQQFRDSSVDFQNKVADWHFDDIDKKATEAGLEKQYGRVINGVTINRDSIRAMAHLGGNEGVKKFISTNGEYDKADRNKTKMSDYGKKFGSSVPTLTAPDLAKKPNWQSTEDYNNATYVLQQSVPAKLDPTTMTDTQLMENTRVNNAIQQNTNVDEQANSLATKLAKYDVSWAADTEKVFKEFVQNSGYKAISKMDYGQFRELHDKYGSYETTDANGKKVMKQIPAARFVGVMEESVARNETEATNTPGIITGTIADIFGNNNIPLGVTAADRFKRMVGVSDDYAVLDKQKVLKNIKTFAEGTPGIAKISKDVTEGTIKIREEKAAQVIAARAELKKAKLAFSNNPSNSNISASVLIAEAALKDANQKYAEALAIVK